MQIGEIRFSIEKADGTIRGQFKTYEGARRHLNYPTSTLAGAKIVMITIAKMQLA
jgi:hypothetical protein